MKSFNDLVLQHEKLALDGPDRGAGDIAKALRGFAERRQGIVLAIGTLLARIRHDRVQERPQILHVNQGEPIVVGNAERDIENAFLHVVQVEHARQQQRAHFGHGRANGVALLPEHIPEHGRELIRLVGEAELRCTLDNEVLGFPDLRDPRKVTLDIGCEDGNTGAGKALRHHLQRDGLPCTGCTRHKAVAIAKRERQPGRLFTLAHEYLFASIGHSAVRCRHRETPLINPLQGFKVDHTACRDAIETGRRHPGCVVLHSLTQDFPACLHRKSESTVWL
jgi:hypothetical protein